MPDESVTKIRIGGNLVGIIGLNEAVEQAAKNSDGRSDSEIKDELLKNISVRNYIPASARDLYGEAVLREFKRFLGQPVSDETPGGIRIAVLGPGCFNCAKLERDVRDVMAEIHLAGDLTHITDVREIARYGVMGVPALVINDRVVCAGTMPHRNKIKEWLIEATSSERKAKENGS
jgi:small redox-active disulfide protein 2